MNTKLVASVALVTGETMPANMALGERLRSGRLPRPGVERPAS